LSLDSGELTPTLKIKRAVVVKQHQAEIDSLYA
jgi:long-subunit acyl-CoA synthetase (AMP-forming)